MIEIAGKPFDSSDMGPTDSTEYRIIQVMQDSPVVYSYQSAEELLFEVKLREHIMLSARLMNQSDAQFATFALSRCNPLYWHLTEFGGFQLQEGVKPSEAINDIFINSSLYAFECAGAKVIIYYHAVLQVIGETSFNQLFQNIYIYSWHTDPDLGIDSTYSTYFLPGDVVYFMNPEVDPRVSHWRGENAVVLGEDTYFGHGIGIASADQIIETLNRARKPGASQSAYLTNLVVRPSFKHLMKISLEPRVHSRSKPHLIIITHNESSISYYRYSLFLGEYYGF
ncbi:protein-glutamine gamma-glutamyltransferase [Virgibacillus sp. C22-A2]|uniref:Protein-glutamine gamma-glutamyltransferase n=1 Tax=Virgibacillus tibetensis TaxID=3042313 RepID=A0ABU6KHN4_9BACI|nr:protein-glutamine gamma-glutamyltransferase [Virgibacillus sp. C22-A2]